LVTICHQLAAFDAYPPIVHPASFQRTSSMFLNACSNMIVNLGFLGG
jgi:hypothetical protein